MTSAVSRLVYMPNFRAIGQSVWEKNGNTQKHTHTHRNTDLNFIKIDNALISYQKVFYNAIQNNLQICTAVQRITKKVCNQYFQ